MLKEPSNIQTLPSAYEKHVSIRSGKQTTYALSKLKLNITLLFLAKITKNARGWHLELNSH
jgi:hypothetical protein